MTSCLKIPSVMVKFLKIIMIIIIFRATILQHESSKIGKTTIESLAKPGVMRVADGK